MPLRSAFFCRIWKITSCFFIVPKFSMPISLAMLFSSAMDIACSWLILIVFPSFTSARGVAAGSSSSGALAGGWRSSEDRGEADSSAGAERATSSGNPSKTSFFFALPLGLADFFATRGINFLSVNRRPGGMMGRNGRHSHLVNQKETTVQSGAVQKWADQGRLIKNQYGKENLAVNSRTR